MKKTRRLRKDLPFRKIVPNMITSGSVLCGFLSLVLVYQGHPLPAAWLVAMAVVFDYLDGKVARSLGGSSAFGVELDSLADVISFGVAPAFLIHSVYIGLDGGLWGALAGAFFALCGALRLARFNVTHVVGPFQGLPIPAAGLSLGAFILAGVPLPAWGAELALVSLGGLMISKVPYGNLKKLRKGNLNRHRAAFLGGFLLLLGVVLKEKAPLAMGGIYVASGLVHLDWGTWLSLRPLEDEEEPLEEEI